MMISVVIRRIFELPMASSHGRTLFRCRATARDGDNWIGVCMSAIKEEHNQRPGVDAEWRVLFAFQRPRPRATQAERFGISSMHTAHRVGIFVVLVLLWRSISLAQSNDVYSFWTSASTLLTGYRVAVV